MLAAGQGTRMRSSRAKVLHDLCGLPMVAWPVNAALAAGAAEVIVVGGPGQDLEPALPPDVKIAVQERPDGTGGAVAAALPHVAAGPLVVLAGDVPLITAEQISALVSRHRDGNAAATMITTRLPDPAGYGRVVRDADGAFERVVETKDPVGVSPAELAIDEVNTGIFCFDADVLRTALERVGVAGDHGERFLPDVLPLLAEAGVQVLELDDAALVAGVNDKAQLAGVRAEAQRRILREHMLAGVDVVDPASTVVDAGVQIAPDATIEPFTCLRGATRVGRDAVVGPCTTVIDSEIGEQAVVRHSYADGALVGPGASVGPFAYLRPGAHLHEHAKAGTFVEIKNSELGAGAKVPHLSYIGDADVGERTNLGAGTITANYDGRSKHRTTIGSDVRSGVDVSFVAPVAVGDGAWTAAGSVITKDVPSGALGIARERQRNIEGYTERDEEDR